MFGFLKKKPARARRIYLDHAAAAPLRPEVLSAMMPYFTTSYGNPSAIHSEGRAARAAIETARGEVARILSIKPAGVVFTAGGTEGNALALRGYIEALRAATGREYNSMEIISTGIEHPSVAETLRDLENDGVVIKTVGVDGEGQIVPGEFEALLSQQTVLVSFAYANSEIGVVQPVHALARRVRAYERTHGVRIAVHVDAAQAPLWLPCSLVQLDVDLLTLDGAKCGGPKGSGVVAFRKDVDIAPVVQGGGQEGGRRPGTENVAGIIGFATALAIAQGNVETRAKAVARVRDSGIETLMSALPGAVLNGPVGEGRLANNINISLPGLDTEYAVVVLDTAGIAASTKSACAGAGSGESVVVKTISGDTDRARSTLRLTLGEETTHDDIKQAGVILAALRDKMAALTK